MIVVFLLLKREKLSIELKYRLEQKQETLPYISSLE